jgi:FtsZ-interacting cell division protein ZipA
MEIEIDFSIENILFVILFIYCIYLLFFSFSYPKKEGLAVSFGSKKKSISKTSDDDEDEDENDDKEDGGDKDGGDDKNAKDDEDGGDDSNDDTTYQTASPSVTKNDPKDGVASNSAHYAKTLKHNKENYLYNLKIPKYKDNYKKLINKISDNTELAMLNYTLSSGSIYPGDTKDNLLNTIEKYS